MEKNREPREDLAGYVQRVRSEKGLSQRDVEVRSGNKISKGYIGQIENRDVLGHSVTPQKLRALAVGLEVSEDEIFDIARGVQRPSVTIGRDDLEDRAKRRELMALLFDDIPDECQLDTLASMIGLHQRRGISLRIHERSAARADTKTRIENLTRQLFSVPAIAMQDAPGSAASATEESKLLPGHRITEIPVATADILPEDRRASTSPDTAQENDKRRVG